VHDSVERALNAMERVRAVKNTLTGAQTQIGKAKDVLDDMAEQVREHLRNVDQLVLAGSPGDEGREPRPKDPQETLV
jgi:rubrerythrin